MRPVLGAEHLSCGWIPGRYFFPRHSLTLIAKGAFDLVPDAPAVPSERIDLQGTLHYEDDLAASPRYESDFAYWKPQADVMLVGSCHAPGGGERKACDVALRVGDLAKRLQVRGPRRWLLPFGPLSPKSGAEPFASLPLRYENAAGGGRSKRNPVGSGRARERDEEGRLLRRVPSVSAPGRALWSPWAQGPPAGFGPVASTWRPRTRKLGSYRRRWRKNRWPWFPENFDWAHFNAAPADQRMPYLRGDEPIELTNLHPEHAQLRSQLPGLRTRCFVRPSQGSGSPADALVEVPLELDTLWIDADAGKLVLLWRGLWESESPDFDEELEDLFFFSEPLAEPPADEAAVRAALARADAGEAGEAESEEPADDPEARRAQVEALVQAELEGFADALEEAGLPRDLMEQPPPTREQLAAGILERVRAMPWSGGDPAAGVALPSPPSAEEEAAILERFGLEIPDLAQPGRLTRDDVEGRHAEGQALGGEDLSGLDLSGLVLAGADLRGCALERAKLAGCDLSEAQLGGAQLAEADLSGAILRGADLTAADLTRALLVGADLSGAVLDDVAAEGADLREARLAEARAERAEWVAVDLREAQLESAQLTEADLSRARLDGARMAGACLRSASLEDAAGERVCLDGADLGNLRAARAELPGASLLRAQAADSVWEACGLAGARFADAVLSGADFADANLAGADFERCELAGARFERAALGDVRLARANLFRGSVERADLAGADLRGANLYEVETLDAELSGAQLRGANLRRTKLG